MSFSCPLCSRLFLRDCPYDGPIPTHLDALLGTPCEGAGMDVVCWLEIPEHAHPLGWPFGIHAGPQEPRGAG